jgi:hypothetical protein
VFPASLITLEGQWIYGIGYELDEDAQGFVGHLCSSGSSRFSYFGNFTLQLAAIAHLQASVHAVVAKSLEEIPVVHEYPDVFLDDLPRMSSHIVIEFKIEL